MRISKGLLISLFTSVVLISLLVWSFMPEPILVETAVIKEDRFQSSFSEDGKTRLRNRYTISAPFTGALLRPRLKVGDRIEQGDVVATLYSAPSPLLDSRTKAELQERMGIAEANIEETTTLLESAQLQFIEAKREYERVKSLVDSGSATRQQLERVELSRNIAERNWTALDRRRHAAEHMLEQARQLATSFNSHIHEEQYSLTAPISGTVVKIYQESEGIVASGSPLFEIGDLQDLEIIADVLTTNLIDIKTGQRVVIDNWGGKLPLEGRVHHVEPTATTKISALGIEEQRSPLIIDIVSLFETWNRLGDQYSVKVTVITNERDRVLLVPTSAIFRKGDDDYVFTVYENIGKLRRVSIGERSQGMAIVASGLKNGEEVIIYPPRELTDGAKISRH